MKILIAEGESALATFLRKALDGEGYSTNVVHESSLILPTLMDRSYQVAILDTDSLSVPGTGETASQLTSGIRLACSTTSLIILSSEASVETRVAQLDAGADDFLSKPFSYFELAARIRALLRRQSATEDGTIHFGEISLNRYARTATRAGKLVDLTAREFRLLEFLMRNHGRCVSRRTILQQVWAGEPNALAEADSNRRSDESTDSGASMTNIVDVYINYLRQKLADTREKRLIHTVRGIGYRLGESSISPYPANEAQESLRAC